MSSFRNAIKRIEHKERSQPSDRKKFGLLEKHKDYIERSQDYKNKRSYVKSLKKKAAERNPDEFYFNMHRSKVENGIHKKKDDKLIDTETAKLLKTQDMGYLIYKKSLEDNKIKKMTSNLHFIDDVRPKSHKLFADDLLPQNLDPLNIASDFRSTSEILESVSSRDIVNNIKNQGLISHSVTSVESISKEISNKYKELRKRINRTNKLKATMQKLSLQRNLMGKGKKVKSDSENQPVYKWKRQRLR